MSVTGAGRSRECFSSAATRGVGDNGRFRDLMHVSVVSKCNRMSMDDDKTNTEIWYCNYCKIIVTNGDMKFIDKNKIQRLLTGFSSGCPLTGA